MLYLGNSLYIFVKSSHPSYNLKDPFSFYVTHKL